MRLDGDPVLNSGPGRKRSLDSLDPGALRGFSSTTLFRIQFYRMIEA
jgi:hypothetical protein